MTHHVFNLKYLEEMDDFNEQIDLDDLYTEKIKSEKMKLDIYNRLLARVHKKIKITSRQKVDDNFCCFIVPEVMLGIPKYNQEECINYLMQKLNNNNFIVKYIHPNCLFISWKHWIPNYVREEFKKQTGIAIDGTGYILNKNENKEHKLDMKMLTYESDNKNTNTNNKKEFKNVNNYKDTGKLLYNEDLLEKLQNIVDKSREK
jgi:hypothetical protein